jgi:hypothetical protein
MGYNKKTLLKKEKKTRKKEKEKNTKQNNEVYTVARGRSSRSKIAPGGTHDHVVAGGASPTGPILNGKPDVQDFKVGSTGEKLNAPSEPGVIQGLPLIRLLLLLSLFLLFLFLFLLLLFLFLLLLLLLLLLLSSILLLVSVRGTKTKIPW